MDKKHLTYIGRRIQKGKLQHCFLEGAEGNQSIVWFPKAKASRFAGARIGTIYEIGDCLPDLWSSAQIGDVEDAQKLQWQTADRGAYLEANERKGSNSPELDDLVDRLKRARYGLTASQRPAFDAWLLNQIR